jgi:multicomponent Na+:H+ antiporter subunit E
MTGRLTAGNLLIGTVIGYAVLLPAQGALGLRQSLRRMHRAAGLMAFFAWELVLANLRVARDVVSPRLTMRPGVIAVPLDARTDGEILLLANLITLTPGTLSVDVSEDRRVLYVHAMRVPDRVRLVRSIKDGFERRVLEVLR